MQEKIFGIRNAAEFERIALEVFQYQARCVNVYSNFIQLLGVNPLDVDSLEKIPFLPISFFKTHNVIVTGQVPAVTFTSSGTTGSETSRHLVSNVDVYTQSFRRAFAHFYGDIKDYCVLALLPAYLERTGSSLVFMANDLIEQSAHPQSGFYLNNLNALVSVLNEQNRKGQKTILLGVTFALLTLAEEFKLSLNSTTVMETGGMKGRRKEIVRQELHQILCNELGVNSIHSEYGMTELLSQAYSYGEGVFSCPPWMKILLRDPYDPLSKFNQGSGAINVIDLANINSCSFIQTDDLGRLHADGTFEVLGRMDNSQIRGCNLLV